MRPLLRQDNADRRQLSDLMATERPTRPTRVITETLPAAIAHRRIVIDDLINPILRLEFATRATVTLLPAGLAPLPTSATRQLLRLLPSFRPALRPRLRRI